MEKNTIISKVFGWMFAGLMVTFITGYYLSMNENTLMNLLSGGSYFLLVILEFGLVFFLSARALKMSSTTARISFLLYSIVTGITFGAIFVVYELESIIFVFGITALLFGIFALIGYYTKIDLTKFGSILLMMLFGIIICSIINAFVGSETFDLALTCVSIIIFLGFVAYDLQKVVRLIDMSEMQPGSINTENIAIIGALELYLDFINLFIDLIRLFGKGRD